MGFKAFFLSILGLLAGSWGFAASLINSPSLDFGSASYQADNAGINTVTVSAEGIVTASGVGNLIHYSGGVAGTVTIGDFGLLEYLFQTVYFRTNGTTTPATVETPGCGRVSISDLVTTNGSTSASRRANASSVSFPVGGKLTLQSFNGTTGCYISGTVTGPLGYRMRSSGSYTNIPLYISIYIAPHMAVLHQTGRALNFGTVCSSARTSQTITVAADGTASSQNAVCPLVGTGADAFVVTGATGQVFSVNLPASATISNGQQTMTIQNFTSSCLTNCAVNGPGGHTFTVGGSLTVPTNVQVGTYSGAYQLSITY